ncbi:MCE family protein [Nocardioides marmoriginsengisoli]|uniref:MCE family protein n=1 Tax=Nocardioides marmoriginsengisoli TaxID=661483 RepID=A0A3N0CCU7_9ACTN|nr:MCE family protein [Nocardioides marmoriginsengisoli]RNL61129.1 MCE family protein [Nocardioides marmoriginsengisoli]
MSTPFRERNPVKIGALSLLVLVAMILVAFKADSLPLIGGGDTYHASFTDSSGLKPNDEVRIAGVRVGKVNSVELVDDHVRVTFKIKTDSKFGVDTGAEIKVKTLLGSMFLSLEPSGTGQLKEGSTIPESRTRSAYDVVDAFSGLAERAQKIDLGQLTQSLNTLAEATANTPEELKSTLKGLSALSANVAARDDQVNSLLVNLRKVSGVLADRNQDVVALMKDGDVLLRAIVARREAVHTLLVSTSRLSTELTALVQQTRADLKPALSNLTGVVNVLRKNQSNLDNSLRLLAPFYRVFANTLGTGPWFDNWISNLPPGPALGVGQ